MMPKSPRRFHIAHPQPASFQRATRSVIQPRQASWGVLLWQPHSPTWTGTPRSVRGFHFVMSSARSFSRFHTTPFLSAMGQVGFSSDSNSLGGSHHLRQLAARALHDALVSKAHHGGLADVGAVGDDEPVGALPAYGGYQGPGYLDVPRLVGHERGLVEKVEAQAGARYVPVPLREVAPMVLRGLEGALHRVARAVEKLVGLHFAAVDAVARDPVQAEVDVDAVAPAHLDGLVDGLERVVVDLHPVLRARPRPVPQGQAGEVEPPAGHPLEVALLESHGARAAGHSGKVESAPPRYARLAGGAGRPRAGGKERAGGRGGRDADEFAAGHRGFSGPTWPASRAARRHPPAPRPRGRGSPRRPAHAGSRPAGWDPT